ncbi:MAG: hypothetical protein ACRC2U_02195, partial [Aeromonas sp.]
ASIINFEDAYFDETVGSDKPENCIKHMKDDPTMYEKIKTLLDAILELNGAQLPEGALTWTDVSELERAVDARIASVEIKAS